MTDSLELRLSGDVDALTKPRYLDAAERLLDGADATTLIVDLREVSTIDSSGLGLLVHLYNRARELGMALRLVNVPPRADALLRRTGLHRVFELGDA